MILQKGGKIIKSAKILYWFLKYHFSLILKETKSVPIAIKAILRYWMVLKISLRNIVDKTKVNKGMVCNTGVIRVTSSIDNALKIKQYSPEVNSTFYTNKDATVCTWKLKATIIASTRPMKPDIAMQKIGLLIYSLDTTVFEAA